jgi:hypothetical protein
MSGAADHKSAAGKLAFTPNTLDLGSARRFSPREITFCEGGDTSGLVQLERPPPLGALGDTADTARKSRRDLHSPPLRSDTGDTVFMVNGSRWESSEATDRKLKMCLKAA